MNKRNGSAMMALGGLMLAYFWLAFDISVSTAYPGYGFDNYVPHRVVNEGLMNDRLVGTMIGMGLLLAGVFVKISGKDPPPKPDKGPPPIPPSGFTFDLRYAMHYRTYGQQRPSISRPVWVRELSHYTNVAGYQSRQIDWAYSMNVAPRNFAAFAGFIEVYRAWYFSTTGPSWALLDNKSARTALWVGLGLLGLLSLGRMVAMISSSSAQPAAPASRPYYNQGAMPGMFPSSASDAPSPQSPPSADKILGPEKYNHWYVPPTAPKKETWHMELHGSGLDPSKNRWVPDNAPPSGSIAPIPGPRS